MAIRLFGPALCRALLALVLLLAGAEGCVRPRFGGSPSAVVLEVSNKGWTDITVLVERGGVRHRLGLSSALSERRFRIPAEVAPAGETIALLADPVGSSEVYRSPSVRIEAGIVIVWTLQNNLAQSSLRTR
ncbi:MAG: hypothetical protein R3E10_18520 [Gemmatimonadota bacterium]